MSKDTPKPHEIRKQLLKNDYIPLPLTDKGPRIVGWSRDTIDETWLQRFARSRKMDNTGLRCDDLIAFDVDVLDEALADQLEVYIEQRVGPTDLLRVGRAPKRLMLYRCDGVAQRSRRTGKYGDHMVELLTGNGRQFVCYGIHPETRRPYTWEADSPLEVPQSALPTCDPDLANDVLDEIEAILAATGLERRTSGGHSGGDGAAEYILQADMRFEIVQPFNDVMSFSEIKQALPEGDSWWCNLTALRPDSDSGAGHLFWTKNAGELCLYDFPYDRALYEQTFSDAQRETLAGLLPDPPKDDEPAWKVIYKRLTDEYVYVASDRSVRHVDQPDFAIPRVNFTDRFRVMVPVGKSAGHPVVNYWLENGAKTADYAALKPETRDLLVKDGPLTCFNTYVEPEFPAGGEVDTFIRFINHLLPIRGERKLCLDWFANKVQNPCHRMHALVMVANEFGTGRNTLIKIMGQIIGYTVKTNLAHFLGRSYQSQYTDWLSGSLLVFIPEAQDTTQDGTGWRERHKAYEHIKQNLETSAEKQLIVRKRANSTMEVVYASMFIATNHYNALAIEKEDRRLIVLENGRRCPAGLAKDIYRWIADARNLGALREYMLARAVEYDPFGAPPDTSAKQRMLDAAHSGADLGVELLIENAPGDIVTVGQVKAYFAYLRVGEDIPVDQMTEQGVSGLMAAKGAMRLSHESRLARIRTGDSQVRPWIIRNADKWIRIANDDSDTGRARIRKEVEKNGLTDKNTLRLAEHNVPPWGAEG